MAGPYRPIIAIAGLNGTLGQETLAALLSRQFINSFQLPIRVLTRAPVDPRGVLYHADMAVYLGVDYTDPETLDAALENVDVVINLLGVLRRFGADVLAGRNAVYPESWIALGESALRIRARLYIPSEFGPDHRYFNYQNPFQQKRTQSEGLREVGLKTVQIFCGIFMEHAIPAGRYLGIDLPRRRIVAAVRPGRPEPMVSFTSVRDVARTIASVASRSPDTLPNVVRVAGDSLTLRQLGEYYSGLVGAPVQVTIHDAAALNNTPLWDISRHYRLAAGAGFLDYSVENSNEWINPGRWQWRSVQRLLIAIQPSPPETRAARRRRLEAEQEEAEAAMAAAAQDRRSTLRSHARAQATRGRGAGAGARGRGRSGGR